MRHSGVQDAISTSRSRTAEGITPLPPDLPQGLAADNHRARVESPRFVELVHHDSVEHPVIPLEMRDPGAPTSTHQQVSVWTSRRHRKGYDDDVT